MKKIRKGRIIVLIITIILIILFGVLIFGQDKSSNNTNNNKPEIVNPDNMIKNYDYVLLDSKSKEYKKVFKSLKENLEGTEIDYLSYASDLSTLFIMEFYDLNNVTSKMDIGGVDFVHKDIRDNFILNAQNTMYKTVETNVDGDREQELPSIKTVTIGEVQASDYTYNDTTYDGYVVRATIEYKKDLGYPTEVEITLIQEDTLLSIVEVK